MLPIVLILLVTLALLSPGYALDNQRLVKIAGISGITSLSFFLLGYALLLLSIEYQVRPPWIKANSEKTFDQVVSDMEQPK